MCDFRMELQRVITTSFIGHAGDGHITRRSNRLETGGQSHDLIAVTHPDIEQTVPFGIHPILDVAQQR